MTERQLIEGCKRGDAKALKQLYETFAGKMFGVCYRYAGNRETARDLLHDGFVTLYTKIGDFRGDGSFEGWVRRIFVTTALGYLRKNGSVWDERPADEMYGLQGDEPSALERLSAEDLLRVIGRLPAGYRTVLNLYAVEGYSHREIAEMLHISENTSRSQYSRARSQLCRLLEQVNSV